MIANPTLRAVLTVLGRPWRIRGLVELAALGLSATVWAGGWEPGSVGPGGTRYYSTAEAPPDYRGPRPTLELALNEFSPGASAGRSLVDQAIIRTEGPAASPPQAPAPAPAPARRDGTPRVASTAGRSQPASLPLSRDSATPPESTGEAAVEPTVRAKQAIAACQARFTQVQDYVCTFHKRERISGRLTQPHIMTMKVRSRPLSIYFKFQRPNKGREAIYVAGRHGGKVVAHDVGLGKLVAGTMRLDPKGSMAMEDNRHPVTEAGIGSLIETVAHHWAKELTPEESRLSFHANVRVGNHLCTMIESIHPRQRPDFLFYMVKLYIDHEHGLPIRFEAYDWPKQVGAAPELVEEYTYLNLRTNVGLRDQDFDPANAQYSYGRF